MNKIKIQEPDRLVIEREKPHDEQYRRLDDGTVQRWSGDQWQTLWWEQLINTIMYAGNKESEWILTPGTLVKFHDDERRLPKRTLVVRIERYEVEKT